MLDHNQHRKKKFEKKFQIQAFQLYSLTAMIEKQKTMADEQEKNNTGLAKDVPISAACNPPVFQWQAFKDLWKNALISLTQLFDFVIEQEKRYEYKLGCKSNFYPRHLIVKHF